LSLVRRIPWIALGVAGAVAGIVWRIPWFVWFGVGFVVVELSRGRENFALIAGIWFFGLGAIVVIDAAILESAHDWTLVIPLIAGLILCSLGALFIRGHFRRRAGRDIERKTDGDTS
jgi:hypothetical protein